MGLERLNEVSVAGGPQGWLQRWAQVRRTDARTPHAYQTRVRERHLPAHVGLRRI